MRPRFILIAVALLALIAAGCGSSSSSSSSASASASAGSGGAKKCTTSIAIEGPFTGPVAQIGLEQLHFAQLAVAMDNAANATNVTLAQDDTQLTPALATQKTQAIIGSGAVAVVGPAGSQEVNAVGPLFGRAGIAFISGSATLPALAASGKNPTFFRVVPDDSVQG
nr:ABC transporter substrate-binding protein [Actinomycetota bacterium]